jgi:hypothetical protein
MEGLSLECANQETKATCFIHMIINNVFIDVLMHLMTEYKCVHHWFALTHL